MMAIGLSKLLKCHFDIFVWTIAVSLLGLFSIAKKKGGVPPNNQQSVFHRRNKTATYTVSNLLVCRWALVRTMKSKLEKSRLYFRTRGCSGHVCYTFYQLTPLLPMFPTHSQLNTKLHIFFYRRQFSGLIVFLLPSAIFTHHRWPG